MESMESMESGRSEWTGLDWIESGMGGMFTLPTASSSLSLAHISSTVEHPSVKAVLAAAAPSPAH